MSGSDVLRTVSENENENDSVSRLVQPSFSRRLLSFVFFSRLMGCSGGCWILSLSSWIRSVMFPD